jgi:hypothetical protein
MIANNHPCFIDKIFDGPALKRPEATNSKSLSRDFATPFLVHLTRNGANKWV